MLQQAYVHVYKKRNQFLDGDTQVNMQTILIKSLLKTYMTFVVLIKTSF